MRPVGWLIPGTQNSKLRDTSLLFAFFERFCAFAVFVLLRFLFFPVLVALVTDAAGD